MADKLSQAYLFVCEDNLTAEELIYQIAKLVICENKEACDVCSSCKKATAKSHPDILVYPKGKNFAVGDASEIYENIQVKPMIANKKIFIINNIDNGTEQAQNKMLKVVEEPPENVIFLMCATNENKVLRTIISRVQKIYVDKININLLKNIINCPENVLNIAINYGDGYIGKTLEIAENGEFIKNYNNVINLLKNLKNSTQIPQFSKNLSENKEIFANSLIILNNLFRDLLMLNLGQSELIKNNFIINDLNQIANEYSVGALIEIIKLISGYNKKLQSNVNLLTLSDGLLLDILEVKFLCK